jgi:hypothetical protein
MRHGHSRRQDTEMERKAAREDTNELLAQQVRRYTQAILIIQRAHITDLGFCSARRSKTGSEQRRVAHPAQCTCRQSQVCSNRATGRPNASCVIHSLSRQPAAVFKNITVVKRQRLVRTLSTGCQLLVLARQPTGRYIAVGTHITDLDLSVTRLSTVH